MDIGISGVVKSHVMSLAISCLQLLLRWRSATSKSQTTHDVTGLACIGGSLISKPILPAKFIKPSLLNQSQWFATSGLVKRIKPNSEACATVCQLLAGAPKLP
jgi:hypothetical protein